MGERFIRAYFRFFTALARVVGLLFVLAGAGLLATSGRQATDDRWLVTGLSLLVLLSGVGLLVAKPATSGQFRRFVEGPRKDSTDQRGPDEWQA